MENKNLKPLYLTLAVSSAAGYFYLPKANWAASSLMIAACLLVAFLGKEKVEDERVEHLKLKAIKAAFAASFILVFLYTWLLATIRREGWRDNFLSAYDMVIITMLVALGLFHYWRWQDGRTVKANQE
jgi:uncharacterized membrane protein YfcA